MTWILILILTTGTYRPPAIASMEFSSKERCEAVQKRLEKHWNGNGLLTECVKK